MIQREFDLHAYLLLQFVGYMLQILPIVFLFYAPFREKCFRFSKKKILTVMSVLTCMEAGGMTACLGLLFQAGYTDAQISVAANAMFSVCLLGAWVIYFWSFRKGINGRMFFFYRLNQKFDLQRTVCTDTGKLRLVTVCSVCIVILTMVALQMEMGLVHMAPKKEEQIYISVLLTCILLSNALAYCIYFGFVILGNEKERMRAQLKMYELQYAQLNRQIESTKRLRHNLRHHFRTLAMLISDEKIEELKKYVYDYIEELDRMEICTISGNPVIDSIMSYYIQQTQNKKIHTEYVILVKENYPFEIRDMTVLLGNAMENAIRETLQCPPEETFIRIVMKQHKKQLLLLIENTMKEKAEEEAAMRGRRKKNYGLESIQMIVEKYNGSFVVQQKDRRFILKMILNMKDYDEKP